MKRVLRMAFWILTVAGTLLLTGFINFNLSEEKCREIIIDIVDKNQFAFIDEGDVLDVLNREFNTPVSQKIGEIDTYGIENRIRSIPAVERADVFISIDGKLVCKIRQKRPVLRIFTAHDNFYIDERGKVMPASPKFAAHVPVASGYIDLNYRDLQKFNNFETVEQKTYPPLFEDLLILSQFIDNHPFWKAQIEQLYVDKESEFELIPRVGNHTIVLGGVDNLEIKFTKLMQFYKEGLSKTGWNEYKTINLKFKGQVVCTKRYN